MSVLHRVVVLNLKEKFRSSIIWEEFEVDLLLLCLQESDYVVWASTVIRTPPDHLPLEVCQRQHIERKSWRCPRNHWRDYIYPLWPENALVSHRRSCRPLLWKAVSGFPSQTCCFQDKTKDKGRKWRDGGNFPCMTGTIYIPAKWLQV